MQPVEVVTRMVKMANADGLVVITKPGAMSAYYEKGIIVGQQLPLMSQMISMSHEMGHHFDFKADPITHTEYSFRTNPYLMDLAHAHSITLYREKRAWVIGEEILQSMGVLRAPRNYRIFSRVKEACLNTYAVRAEGAGHEEIKFRADVALYILLNPEEI